MPNVDFTRAIQIIYLAGVALLSFRLFRTGVSRRYPIFFGYCLVQLCEMPWALFFDIRSNAYEHFWILSQPIAWLFHMLVVVELCNLVLKGHRGLYSLLKWAMYGSVGLAIAISLLSLLPKIKPGMSADTKMMGYWFAAERGIDFALAIFLLLILAFLSRYPMRLSRNILAHAALYTIYFFGTAFSIFMRTFGIRTPTASNAAECISVACILGWIVFLTPKGEEVKTSFPTLNPRHEKAALRQLESLNASLLKVSLK